MKKDNRQEPRKATGRQGRSLVQFAIAILVVLGLVFGGWGTVYAAQNSEPDDFLYPVKMAVEYLEDFTLVTVIVDDITTTRERDGVQKQPRDQIQGMTHIDDHGVDWGEESLPPMYRYGQEPDDTGDDTIRGKQTMSMTQTMSGTQVMSMTREMSGTLSMTREMSGTLYGPGQCVGDTDNCPPEIDIPLGYSHTYTSGLEAPYEYKGDVDQQPEIDQPDPALGFGPGEPPAEEVKESVGNTPSGNSGATDTDQKKGGK